MPPIVLVDPKHVEAYDENEDRLHVAQNLVAHRREPSNDDELARVRSHGDATRQHYGRLRQKRSVLESDGLKRTQQHYGGLDQKKSVLLSGGLNRTRKGNRGQTETGRKGPKKLMRMMVK
jgi:hypothetical protein